MVVIIKNIGDKVLRIVEFNMPDKELSTMLSDKEYRTSNPDRKIYFFNGKIENFNKNI